MMGQTRSPRPCPFPQRAFAKSEWCYRACRIRAGGLIHPAAAGELQWKRKAQILSTWFQKHSYLRLPALRWRPFCIKPCLPCGWRCCPRPFDPSIRFALCTRTLAGGMTVPYRFLRCKPCSAPLPPCPAHRCAAHLPRPWGRYPGCEQWTLDAYLPAFVLTSFLPATDETDAQLAAIGQALAERWAVLAPGQPLNWVFQCRNEALRHPGPHRNAADARRECLTRT